jgi:hypothetical protein
MDGDPIYQVRAVALAAVLVANLAVKTLGLTITIPQQESTIPGLPELAIWTALLLLATMARKRGMRTTGSAMKGAVLGETLGPLRKRTMRTGRRGCCHPTRRRRYRSSFDIAMRNWIRRRHRVAPQRPQLRDSLRYLLRAPLPQVILQLVLLQPVVLLLFLGICLLLRRHWQPLFHPNSRQVLSPLKALLPRQLFPPRRPHQPLLLLLPQNVNRRSRQLPKSFPQSRHHLPGPPHPRAPSLRPGRLPHRLPPQPLLQAPHRRLLTLRLRPLSKARQQSQLRWLLLGGPQWTAE